MSDMVGYRTALTYVVHRFLEKKYILASNATYALGRPFARAADANLSPGYADCVHQCLNNL